MGRKRQHEDALIQAGADLASEAAYAQGRKALARELMSLACRELGTKESQAATVLAETEAALHSLCEDLDIEYPKDLHPADIIEKYLRRHIEDNMVFDHGHRD